MNKAFIFDMDGVIIDTETTWDNDSDEFYNDLYGGELYRSVKNQLTGIRLADEYKLVKSKGFTMSFDEFLHRYEVKARDIYEKAPITDGIEALLDVLSSSGFNIAIVTSSSLSWVSYALKRISNSKKFSHILSLSERTDLNGKPAPDGYLEMMKRLDVTPDRTIIMEDSDNGIAAALNSGAYTVCLKEHLPQNSNTVQAHLTVNKLVEFGSILKLILI